MEYAVLFGLCALVSGVVIRFSISLAGRLGAMDRPGGHKQHAVSTPFVGGFGLISVLAVAFAVRDLVPGGPTSVALLVGALAMFVTGLADDIRHLGFKSRFVVQAVVALSMVYVGGVELASLGELLPGVEVELGWLGVPVTVFATIGMINAVNMIDGIDGLSGSVSLVSLAFIAVVAQVAGNSAGLLVAVALAGGVAGFLYFNLRYPGNSRARVFLGDNGSMLLGFVFAWLLIALSQGGEGGEAAAMTPVTALWLFALPLMDTVGVMLRRIWLGKSPFRADRHHLHHLLVRAGFRVCDVIALAVVMQIVCALVGVGGLLLRVPEYLMFWLFLGVFAVYLLIIARPWRLVPWLERFHRRFGLPSAQVRGIFVGYVRRESCPQLLALIAQGISGRYDYQLSVFETDRKDAQGRQVYCLVHVPQIGDEHLIGAVRRDVVRLRRRLARKHGLDIRLLLSRIAVMRSSREQSLHR